uniref:Thioredoxin domain-containing protein 17 n=1 Tax=Echinococcus granulosus TaxID=6210 RepID=A0A068WII8_ECHGR|nr:protein of unknown function DUF953 thioredoxin [Echinococcus granulosus]
MPAKQIYVRSHKEIEEKLEEIFASNGGQKVILLLEGSTDMTGESWNKACQEVETLLEPLLNSASEKTVFLMAEVGNEEAWRDEANFFKKHAIYKLTAIPTLFSFTGPESVAKRLDGPACLDKDAEPSTTVIASSFLSPTFYPQEIVRSIMLIPFCLEYFRVSCLYCLEYCDVKLFRLAISFMNPQIISEQWVINIFGKSWCKDMNSRIKKN